MGGLVLLVLLETWLGSWLYPAILFLFLGLSLFLWRDWRCPACGQPLASEFSYTYCARCGARLSA